MQLSHTLRSVMVLNEVLENLVLKLLFDRLAKFLLCDSCIGQGLSAESTIKDFKGERGSITA